MSEYLWLIPLLPAIGAATNLLVGRFLPKFGVSLLSCGTVFGSFILAVITFFQLLNLPPENRVIRDIVYTWIQTGNMQINLGFLVDPLSIVLILVVTGVGFIIHLYSVGYMAEDKRYSRYFGFLNLFVFAMLLLVCADNLLVMFVGWEGVGLCSYLLIGFWFEKKENAIAGMKAFIVNRIGDFGFVLGIILLFWSIGTHAGIWTINIPELREHIHAIGPGLALVIGLLLFMGATGKSAQIPLYVWLPDAMAGPTPVSALIHAATMVTAGVYMIARLSFLYEMAPTAMAIVAIVGLGTAIYAGTIALVQNDIKRVLAYSTISQLGYMFLGVGVGAFCAGIFHLMTHAFFKALLFLGAGSVMHALGGETDIRKMGGLRKYLPITFWTFLIAALAIVGIPGFSGFFSKDEILWKAFSSKNGHFLLWLIGVAGAGLTALYMFRLVFMTFFGEFRASGFQSNPHSSHKVNAHSANSSSIDSHSHYLHESPPIMTIPLIILAILSVIGGYVGIPHALGGSNHFEKFLKPVFTSVPHQSPHLSIHGSTHLELLLMVISVIFVLSGIGVAYYCYILKPQLPLKLTQRFSGLYKLLLNKYYVDEIYQKVFVNNLLRLNQFLAYKIDLGIIDKIVDSTAMATVEVSKESGEFDYDYVDGAVNATGRGVLEAGGIIRQVQSGRLKHYLALALGGVIILVICFGLFGIRF